MEDSSVVMDTINMKRACVAECCNSPPNKIRQQGRKKQNMAGRNRNDESGKWKLLSCGTCCGNYIHNGCLTGLNKHRAYVCADCTPVVQEVPIFVASAPEIPPSNNSAIPAILRPRRVKPPRRSDPLLVIDKPKCNEPATVEHQCSFSRRNVLCAEAHRQVEFSHETLYYEHEPEILKTIRKLLSIATMVAATIFILLGVDVSFGLL